MSQLLLKLSFPGLGLEFDIDRVAFTVAGRPVYWYGIIIAVGFLLAAIYALGRTRRFGLDSDRTLDVILGCLVLGVIGARLYYVLFSWDTYRDSLGDIWKLWKGGLAIYGGIIGGAAGAYVLCRWRKVKLLPLLDLMSGSLLLGQAIGRWGNFVNMEAFGSNTGMPWGMTSPGIQRYLAEHASTLSSLGVVVDPQLPVHPTFLYESLWCLLGCLVLHWYAKRRRFDGELVLIYAGWYGLGRFFIEGLRTDSLLLGSVRVSQIVAALCVLACVLLLITIYSRIRRSGDPDYLRLYVDTPEGKAVLAGDFNKKPKSGESTSEDEEAESDTDAGDCAAEDEEDEGEKPESLEEDAAPSAPDAAEEAEPDGGDNAGEDAQPVQREDAQTGGEGD